MSFLPFVAFSDWLLLAVVLCSLLYFRATQFRHYWKKQNLAHEKLSLFFGPQLKQLFQPFHLVEQELYKKHGRVFGSFEDGKPVLYIAEPELIKLVLVKDASKSQRKIFKSEDPVLGNLLSNVETEKWKKLRSATSPAFTTSKLRKMQVIIDSCAGLMSKRLEEVARESKDIDIMGLKKRFGKSRRVLADCLDKIPTVALKLNFFDQYTLNSVARCSFGANLSPNSAEEKSMIEGANYAFFVKITPLLVLKALLLKLSQAFHERFFNPDAFNFYKYATLDIIRRREENGIMNEDFLQMMLNAKEASKVYTQPSEQSILIPGDESSPLKPENIKNLSEEEAVAQCVLFFLAGQDTTSSILSFVAHMLALNPAVQDKLRAEVDECLQKHHWDLSNSSRTERSASATTHAFYSWKWRSAGTLLARGNTPTYDEVSKLPYLDSVVNESLRMMPSATRLERAPTEDYVLGDTGITVPRDCSIVIPVYAMHHDPEFFPEPHVFNPDRFSKENVGSIRLYSFLPFGAGPHGCIGMRFGIQMIKTCLLHAVHNVQFVPCPKTKVIPDFQVGYGLLRPKELYVGIRERSKDL